MPTFSRKNKTGAESQLNLRRAAESLSRIDPGNLLAVNTLVNLIETTDDYDDRLKAVYSLARMDPGNLLAVNTLVNLIETTDDYDDRLKAVDILGQIGAGSQTASNALVHFLQTFEDDDENQEYKWRLADDWTNTLQGENLPLVVTGLKDCMSKHVINCRSYLYEDCYRLIWHCAQHMTYPNFYQAWHK